MAARARASLPVWNRWGAPWTKGGPGDPNVAGEPRSDEDMGKAKVIVAVATMLTGAAGAGVVAGGALVAGAFWAWTTLYAPGPSIAEVTTPVAVADVNPIAAEPIAAPVATTPAKTAATAPAKTTVSTTPAKSTTMSRSGTSTTVTRGTSTTSSRGSSTTGSRGTTSTTVERGSSSRTAEPAPDLLADEDEWEELGFEEAPDVAPATPDEEIDAEADEELDAILEDF